MSARTKKPETPPVTEVVISDAFEAWELRGLSYDQHDAEERLTLVARRMSAIAKSALDGAGLTDATIAEWTFHIDADTKRVLLRKGEARE